MSQFAPEDRQGSIDFVSDRDITFEADRDQDGAGDIVFKTGGVERARLNHDGTGTGPFGGSVSSIFNVKTGYGAAGDGATDDTTAVQNAINAAAVAGGLVFLPAGSYKVTSVTLASNVRLVGAGVAATTLSGTAGDNVLVLPTVAANTEISVEHLTISGGSRGISYEAGATAQYTTYFRVRHVKIAASGECVYTEGAIEEWYFDDVDLDGGTYGFRHANVNNSAGSNYIDKCTFKDVRTTGQSLQGWRVEAAIGNSVTFINPIVQVAGQDGMYFDGGLVQFVFVNVNTEANGQTGKKTRTTGSITSGSSTLTVASATGYSTGDQLTVAGAGANGLDLVATISTISGTTVTLAANAATTVASAAVTNAIYDDIKVAATIAGSSNWTFVGGSLGGEATTGNLRYSLNLGSCNDATLIGISTGSSDLPVYDPQLSVRMLSGQAALRSPSTFGADLFSQVILTNGVAPRSQIPSPPGKNIVLGLRDSNGDTTGTFGQLEVRRLDGNRTLQFWVPAKGPVAARNGFTQFYFPGAGKTTMADADFDVTPGDGTIAVHYDTTAGKTYFSARANGAWHVMAGPI